MKGGSEIEHSNLNTTTETFKPGGVLEWEASTLHCEDERESSPVADSSPTHPTRYSTTKEQQMGATRKARLAGRSEMRILATLAAIP